MIWRYKVWVNQILFSIVMSSFCGVNRICKIALFTGDSLVRVLLKQSKAINENDISIVRIKTHKLQIFN